jgi:ATP adenylyltransferase
MELLCTPWRMAYITGTDDPKNKTCVLCDLHIAEHSHDRENLLLYRGTTCYIVLNKYPYNTGHLMVVPYQHTADLAHLDDSIGEELFFLSRRCVTHLTTEYGPQGFNLGMNLGRIAGAGIDEHLHMHIVPRWGGDTNFMPLIGDTKLVPETLDKTYARLQPFFVHDGDGKTNG